MKIPVSHSHLQSHLAFFSFSFLTHSPYFQFFKFFFFSRFRYWFISSFLSVIYILFLASFSFSLVSLVRRSPLFFLFYFNFNYSYVFLFPFAESPREDIHKPCQASRTRRWYLRLRVPFSCPRSWRVDRPAAVSLDNFPGDQPDSPSGQVGWSYK